MEVCRHDLRLYLRKRDKEGDTYGPYHEEIFTSDAKNTVKYSTKDLENRIFELENIPENGRDNLEIALIRHHPNRYKWLIMSEFTDSKYFYPNLTQNELSGTNFYLHKIFNILLKNYIHFV